MSYPEGSLSPRGSALRLPLLLTVGAFLLGCGGAGGAVASRTGDGGPVLPDTQTVDGVLVMRHDAGAFDRAPVWVLDSVPEVVYSGGEDPEFDLSASYFPVRFADGRLLVSRTLPPARVMVFEASGRPWRVIARTGSGPGDVMSPLEPVLLPGDTALVVDPPNKRVNWITADGGVARSAPLAPAAMAFCFRPNGLLPGGRLVALSGCVDRVTGDTTIRLPTPLVSFDLDFGAAETIATVPGIEVTPMQTRFLGRMGQETVPIRFGRRALASTWDSLIVVATGEGGYVLEERRPDGTVTGRILVAAPRRAVTAAMVQAAVDREMARLTGPQSERMVDARESQRIARETPAADSLPPYQELLAGTDGLLWVVDGQALGDSTWSATAFRHDGAIVARIEAQSGPGAYPVWFGEGRVMVREVNGDGVVRYAVFHMAAGDR